MKPDGPIGSAPRAAPASAYESSGALLRHHRQPPAGAFGVRYRDQLPHGAEAGEVARQRHRPRPSRARAWLMSAKAAPLQAETSTGPVKQAWSNACDGGRETAGLAGRGSAATGAGAVTTGRGGGGAGGAVTTGRGRGTAAALTPSAPPPAPLPSPAPPTSAPRPPPAPPAAPPGVPPWWPPAPAWRRSRRSEPAPWVSWRGAPTPSLPTSVPPGRGWRPRPLARPRRGR